MTVYSPLQYPSGKRVYPCGTTSYAPTNPKTGPTVGGNTLVWNANSHQSTVIYPRQGGTDTTRSAEKALSNVPTTTDKAPYLSTYKNPSTDKYGRYGVKLDNGTRTSSAKQAAINVYQPLNVSRYTTESGIRGCPPSPPAPKVYSKW
ncbi:hypothetical protein FACS1894170_07690 [Planctomycetales bacterium]|nr:hypothetical protein FACS1894170_07690 [Planctomycetales bacterium]